MKMNPSGLKTRVLINFIFYSKPIRITRSGTTKNKTFLDHLPGHSDLDSKLTPTSNFDIAYEALFLKWYSRYFKASQMNQPF